MKSIVVGTAGHIDHGKTALVKALTGIDADRLEEEKRRGITIDLGFAHLDLPVPDGNLLRIGFVDVPGHERFVHNMLAGAAGIDLVLLVIAANESIKPQTREHFDICRLLGVKRGIAVITKSDLVDSETLEVVRLEVEDFLRESFLGKSDPGRNSGDEPPSVLSASSLTGAGLDDVKRALLHAGLEVAAKDSSALVRLPIDRVFTMKGFGTVITGTLLSGVVGKEDELELHPSGMRLRVRGVQVHGNSADRAIAGQRTALNLAAVGKEQMARGMVLAPPGVFHPTSRISVSLFLLASAKPLKDRSRVHLHAYTWETLATVVLLNNKQLEPGRNALAELRLESPTLLLPGDRFIVRQFSPLVTIGGGVVLDAVPMRKQAREETIRFLEILQRGSSEEALAARVARRGKAGLSIAAAVAETGWRGERITSVAKRLVDQKILIPAFDGLISAQAFEESVAAALASLEAFHKTNPLVAGVSREALREQLGLAPSMFAALLETLAHARKIESQGEVVRLAGRGVELKDEEAASKKIIEDAFASAGLSVPSLDVVLAGLKVDRARAQKIVTLLLRDRVLVKVSADLVFHRTALDQLRKLVSAQKPKSSRIDVARFKELAGVTRKYAIPLLEYLDREHITRRVGDEREVL